MSKRNERSSGRRSRRGSRVKASFTQLPRQKVINTFKPVEILSEDQIEDIHNATMDILENIGIMVRLPRAREILKNAGQKVDEDKQIVYFDRGFVMEAISHAPSEFTMHAPNPECDLDIGGKNLVFSMVASTPNATDLDGGRRTGNQKDYRNFLRLTQSLNILGSSGGYPVEPVDIHASIRHLECGRDYATLTEKVPYIYSLGRDRNLDGIEMARIMRGISHEEMLTQPSLFTIINSNSPLMLDQPMLEGIIEMAAHGQVVMLTPFTLSGAMAPVTLAGALAQQNAEALAGISLAQTVRPGAPVVYGGFTSNVDMKSGAPAFGTPEYAKATIASGQLIRRYNLPYRSSNVNASNAADAQAAYESEMSLWSLVLGGANFVKHAAGWLEGGLSASFEKVIMDVEMIQMMIEMMKPIDTSKESLGLDAMREAGHGGHFFGTQHTQARYQTAFYEPILSDWRNFESWAEAGSPDALKRANVIYKAILAEYEPPAHDPARLEELNEFIDKRIAEGGVKTDF
ncbi:MAG: methyltransferase [Sneathiella sp.]|uniref:trimethylamine methyltransferase family protein n=1 Tax=Sneathiella sp. TaxID=1964365 RepID=UPI000C3DBC66|nr:trimethylamine methyltransferase family protein [Sneathiella sp.]MAZ02878.1 methyltransferase [Sneathiella sp.]